MVQSSQVTPFPADEPLRFERLSVFVRGLEVEAGIGVYDHEQGRLQRLVIDVTLELASRPIERLGDTINYETVADAARAIAAEARGTLLQTPGSPQAVAEAVLWLIDARMVTGQMIAVDGGQHLAWRTPDIQE